jgi:glycosyltransferase involved in cell wall biosynthesis
MGIHDAKWIETLAPAEGSVLFCASHEVNLRKVPAGIEVLPLLSSVYSPTRFWARRKTLGEIRKVLKDRRIELLHSMYAVPNALWADESGTLPHIVTTRGSDVLVDYAQTYAHPKGWRERIAYGLMRFNLSLAFQRAVAITCTSERQAEVAAQLAGGRDRIHLVRTGVDVDTYERWQHQFKLNHPQKNESALLSGLRTVDTPVTLLSPRSMKPLYNQHLLVEAFAGLRARYPGAQLTIINDQAEPAYAAKVRDLVASLGLNEAISFLPQQTPQELAERYLHADLVVMIPSSDGTPVSAIEAMLMSRPVLLSALEYDQDLFSDATCWRVPNLTVQGVQQALEELLSPASLRLLNERTLNAYLTARKLANRRVEMDRVRTLYTRFARRNAR